MTKNDFSELASLEDPSDGVRDVTQNVIRPISDEDAKRHIAAGIAEYISGVEGAVPETVDFELASKVMEIIDNAYTE